MKPFGEMWLILMSVALSSVVLYITLLSILFSYISAGASSRLRTSVQSLPSFLPSSVLAPPFSTTPSVEAATFVRFLTFL